MAGVNKVILVGHLGKDPETRYMPSGGAVTTLRIATSEQWKDKQTGERREATEWHSVSMFDKLAEIAAQYLRKGSQVYVEGSLRTRKWQDKDGQDRYTTEIRATEMQMLGGRPGGSSSDSSFDEPQRSAPRAAPAPSASRPQPDARPQAPVAQDSSWGGGFEEDDIPF